MEREKSRRIEGRAERERKERARRDRGREHAENKTRAGNFGKLSQRTFGVGLLVIPV